MRSGVIAAVLIIIIIVAVVLAVRGSSRGGPGAVPKDVLERERPVFNLTDKTVEKATTKQWEQEWKVDPEAENYRVHAGKRYAPVMTCHSCGKETAEMPMKANEDPAETDKRRAEYKCPLCGGPAYPPMM